MGLELYLDLLSPPCRAVYLFARRNCIAFELKDVELFKDAILGTSAAAGEGGGEGSAQPGPPTKVTLAKKVPVLKEDDFILAEGTAILLYLSRKYKTPDHWYPSDLRKRAKVDEYLSWHQANIRANAPKTMWIKVLIPLLTGQALPAEKLEEVMEGLGVSLRQLEGMFLQEKPFLVGSEVSLADLTALVELMQSPSAQLPPSLPLPPPSLPPPSPLLSPLPLLQPVGVGCDIFKDRPKLAAWRDRVEAALGKELFLQAHQLILNIKQLSTIQINPQLKEQLAPVLLKMMK
uniref:glutathione transferase n=1 Tax=Pogona vitticeps TaxID=103695 RepID=A0ABM5F244_9SAUR